MEIKTKRILDSKAKPKQDHYWVLKALQGDHIGIMQDTDDKGPFIPAFALFDMAESFINQLEIEGLGDGYKTFYISQVKAEELLEYPCSVWFMSLEKPTFMDKIKNKFTKKS